MPSPRRPSPRYPKGPDENQPFLEWVHSQIADALGSSYTSLASALAAASAVAAHAPRHIRGGTDQIDGDLLDVDYIPSSYTRTIPGSATATDPATNVEHLAAHLKGVNAQFFTQAGQISSLTSSVALLSPLLLPIQTESASKTLVLADAFKCLLWNSASAQACTVPTNASVAYGTGTIINNVWYGAGTLTFVAAGGVTVRSLNTSLTGSGRYCMATLVKIGTDEWLLAGGLA